MTALVDASYSINYPVATLNAMDPTDEVALGAAAAVWLDQILGMMGGDNAADYVNFGDMASDRMAVECIMAHALMLAIRGSLRSDPRTYSRNTANADGSILVHTFSMTIIGDTATIHWTAQYRSI